MKEKIIKQEKGITLIALVITIIVLLILAGVAISMLSGENGILNQAAEAKTQTEKSSTEEQVKLAAMSALTAGNGEIKGAEAYKALNDGLKDAGYTGEEIAEGDLPKTITINGTEYVISGNGTTREASEVEKNVGKEITGEKAVLLDANNEQIVVPVGFKIKEDSRTEVKGGIVVVAPDGSEFVWVPVTDITKMAKAAATTEEKDSKGRTNYQGILYSFSSTGATEKTIYGQGTDYYREPSLVTGNDEDTKAVLESVTGTSYDASSSYYDNILGYGSAIEFGKAMQEDYNEMIDSVDKNKGFYVGRYETSLNTTTGYAQSKLGEKSATAESSSANTWYGLYKKQKEYSGNNNITNNVGSSMIWGSQYDQMMIWMQSNNIDVTNTTPTNLEGKTTSKNTSRITGSKAEDKLNNIYDLLGNSYEWSLEAYYTYDRISRGGFCYDSSSPSYRSDSYGFLSIYPYDTNSYYGSRLTLYVK